ncbi:glycoside hydrolase family 55 protein [Massilia sp. YIM B04103]|uniref:glycoside hydrolase family 55 protein n=1 Tax=Massilia sp. YIM B04103 TaxID=2963106 RepID=UPI00210ED37F
MKKFSKLLGLLVLAATTLPAAAQGQQKGDAVLASSYGVKCDGMADDTAAINHALSATAGRQLHFPAGTCLYAGGGVLQEGSVIVGAGRHATVIRATRPDATLFTTYGTGSGIRGFKFNAAVTQTGGSYVLLNGQESFVEDFYMDGDYNGILMTGSVTRIRHGRFQDGAPGAIRIRAEGGDNSQMIDDVLMGAQQPQVSYAGIRVRNSAALIISNTSVIQQGIGLLVDPYTHLGTPGVTDAGSVYSLWVHHCFFDNSGVNGIRIAPTGDGSVVRSRFDSVWAGSSAGDGVYIVNNGKGLVSGIHFTSPHLVLSGGSGITTGGAVSDLAIVGGELVQNAHGAWLNPGASGVRITDATIGAGAGGTGNTGAGVVISKGADYVMLSNNDMRGNGTALVNNNPGSNQIIKNNFGAPSVGPQ